MAISAGIGKPESVTLSEAAVWLLLNARMDQPSPWRSRWARWDPMGSDSSTAFIRDLTERQRTETRMQELQSELAYMSASRLWARWDRPLPMRSISP